MIFVSLLLLLLQALSVPLKINDSEQRRAVLSGLSFSARLRWAGFQPKHCVGTLVSLGWWIHWAYAQIFWNFFFLFLIPVWPLYVMFSFLFLPSPPILSVNILPFQHQFFLRPWPLSWAGSHQATLTLLLALAESESRAGREVGRRKGQAVVWGLALPEGLFLLVLGVCWLGTWNSMCSLLLNLSKGAVISVHGTWDNLFSVFLGNGLQTGPESSGFPFTYNHGHTYAGSGRGNGRGPVNPAPANSVQPFLPAVSNGRDPRRAFKRWLCQMWLYSLLKLYTLLEHLLHFYLWLTVNQFVLYCCFFTFWSVEQIRCDVFPVLLREAQWVLPKH